MTGHPDQLEVYGEVRDLAEDFHHLVATLAAYPPEIAAIVVSHALKGSPIRGKRKARFRGLVYREVRALREARAAGDPVPFADQSLTAA